MMLAGLVVIATTAAAHAGMTAKLSSGFNRGGAFSVTRSGDMAEWANKGIMDDFRSFCVEDVTFRPGTWYDVTIEDRVYNGAVGLNTLEDMTKNLFAMYHYDYGIVGKSSIGNSNDKNRAMQAIFWDLEQVHSGASGSLYSVNYNKLGSTSKTYYDDFVTFAQNNTHAGADNVLVMNLWKNQNDAQSQLVVGDFGVPPTPIPAPGSVLLGAMGLGLVNYMKRRLA